MRRKGTGSIVTLVPGMILSVVFNLHAMVAAARFDYCQ
jgi:hypothetical protein